jgi:gas vesicle protein
VKTEEVWMQEFWISFYAGLWSGLISSFVGGIIVGIAIWLLQINKENREVRRNCERELLSFIDRLIRDLLTDVFYQISTSPSSVLPEVYEKVASRIDNLEVSYWSENIKRKEMKRTIELIKKVKNSYNRYKTTCYMLEVNVNHELHEMRISSGNAQNGRKYMYCSTIGIDIEKQLTNFSGDPYRNNYDTIKEKYSDQFSLYKSTMNELINDITVLKGKLNTQMKNPN